MLGTPNQGLIQTLPQITQRTLIPVPQDEPKATYCSLLTKSQGWLQPMLYTAHQLEAQIRAYQIFPRSRFTLIEIGRASCRERV